MNKPLTSIPKHALLEIKCLPHSTGVSSEEYVTVAFRSLFANLSESFNDMDKNPLLYSQFRIKAQITSMIHQPNSIHATFLSTANSSRMQRCDYSNLLSSDYPITCTSKPIATGTHWCTWDRWNSTTTTTDASNNNTTMEEEGKTIHHMDDFINDRHQVLVFPIKYNDLPRNACLYIQLVTVKDTLMAQVYLPLWNAKGRLVTGLQRVKMDTHRLETMHSVANSPTLVQGEYDTSSHEYEFDEKWEATLILDKIQQFQMQREFSKMKDSSTSSTNVDTMHSNRHGSISNTSNSTSSINTSTITTTTNSTSTSLHPSDSKSVPWLDEMTSMRCKDILQEPITYNIYVEQDENMTMRDQPTYQYNMISSFSQPQSATFHLILELLDCPIPIVHQEVLYTPHHVSVASISSASGSVTALDLAMNHKANQSSLESKKALNTINQHQEDHSTHNGYRSGVYMPNPIANDGQEDDMGLRLVQYFDPESIDDNPVEDKYRTLQHELIRGLVDPALKPNAEERSTLNAIISGTRQHLTSQEKDLLWKFRFSLVDNRQALTKFLLAVEWTVESEVVQAAELLEQWRRRSPIEVSDALKLLGRNVAFQTDLVRGYAIDTLQEAPDVELSLYLLQLVQALKYEHVNVENTVISDVSKKRNTRYSSLSEFLIQRASKNIELANYLYWYLKVELDDGVFGRRYREVFSDMREQLLCIEHESSSTLEHRSMWDVLAEQDIFISNVMECQRKSRDAKGKKDAKEEFLKDSLAKSAYQSMNQDWSVPLPSAPHIWVKGVKADSARMFKSALYPALIDFYVDDKLSSRDQSHLSKETYKVIVKTGDDLRQDQLVITLIKLMDRILKRGALDLCLKPYPIIAMSQNTGLVTFVEGSVPISQVLASYNNSILSFLKNVAPSDEGKYNVDPNVMQTYIRSCAGYCVITYLIGVGDRHLDNIMLQPSGHFFHIDFGFIFGRDPKPLPPLFRLTKEMIEGMGGQESSEYKQFCSLACQAFNLLRKRAGLVLNLLHLMSDAGIEDLSNHPTTDVEGVIAKVEERFRLELSDEQAEAYFLSLVNECISAIAPRVMDVFHQIAVARR